MGPRYSLQVHCSEEIGGPTPLALNTEWLLTDGLGGFSMGSVSGCATRRYHGLLIASANPPVERFNTLNSLSETLRIEGHEHHLDCHEFLSPEHHSVFHPHGFQYLQRFEKTPGSVRWHYRVGPLVIVKELRRVWKRPGAVIRYRLGSVSGSPYEVRGPITLEVTPLLAMRDIHQQRRPHWGDPFRVHVSNHSDAPHLHVAGDIPLELHVHCDGGFFSERRDWWHNFRRRREAERGQDDLEDLFTPGTFVQTFETLGPGAQLTIYVSTGPIDRAVLDGNDGREAHLEALGSHLVEHVFSNGLGGAAESNGPGITQGADPLDPRSLGPRLAAACDDFIVQRRVAGQEFRSIIAGYPWFSDWGRDTMISLPGLMLCTGRFKEAGQTLTAFARHIRNGLAPNYFDDRTGEPTYNTVDGSLWFIHACLEYRRVCGDRRLWNEVLGPGCQEIIRAYREGTQGPIRMDDDGLIDAGNEHTQLTWMDAMRDGVVFTPRYGKCVEINALWHRGLVGCAEALEEEDPSAAHEYDELARRVRGSFAATFWSEELGYLLDHVNSRGADRSLRPNQVLAVSLPGAEELLPGGVRVSVMENVRAKLLTPMGLRTLPRDDPNYCPRHWGSMFDRDRAYHQGTVWAWLIGPYVEGWLRAHGMTDAAREHARSVLRPLVEEMDRHSLGQIHEIFDGDEPHNPSGCIAQAWSVAEVLRAWILTLTESL